jgi:hypothetical protein
MLIYNVTMRCSLKLLGYRVGKPFRSSGDKTFHTLRPKLKISSLNWY